MAGFKFTSVLRARRAQEDAAKAAVVRARAEADTAAVRVRVIERDLDGNAIPDVSSAAAFTAALSARNALASALQAAMGVVRLAEDGVQERIDELIDAAVQRRTIEKLEERHAATRRRAAESADLKAIDDLTTAAHSRQPEEPRA